MDDTVKCGAGHDVDEQTGDLVHGMEDQRVAPHGDGYCVVAQRQTESADEEAFAAGEEPDAQDHEEVDKIAKVGEEVVVAYLVVLVPANRHEIG